MSPWKLGCLSAVAAFFVLTVLGFVVGQVVLDLPPRTLGLLIGRLGFHASWITGLLVYLWAARRRG